MHNLPPPPSHASFDAAGMSLVSFGQLFVFAAVIGVIAFAVRSVLDVDTDATALRDHISDTRVGRKLQLEPATSPEDNTVGDIDEDGIKHTEMPDWLSLDDYSQA